MRYYMIASHAYLADGMLSSIELILGKQENVSTYSAYIGGDDSSFIDEIKNDLSKFQHDDEVIIMTDLFGGSVNNEIQRLTDDPRVHVIAGVNLACAMSIMMDKTESPADVTIKEALSNIQDSMVYCNDFQILSKQQQDEDF